MTPKAIQFWESVLQVPGTNEPLVFIDGKNRFESASGNFLEWNGQLVDSIQKTFSPEDKLAEHYIEHYAIDATTFDYFENYEDGVTRFEQKMLHDTIIRQVPDQAGIILDMGCGNAWVAAHFLSKGKRVISADIGQTNILKALDTYPGENHFGLCADANRLPLKDNSVDVVIAAEIMEHVYDPTAFIASLYRVLKSGGVLIITTPYHEKIEYSLCVHCNQATPRHAHLHSFHEKNVRTLFPPGVAADLFIFMNKYLLKSRLYIMLQWLPSFVWRWIDRLMEQIIPGALRFMIVIKKT